MRGKMTSTDRRLGLAGLAVLALGCGALPAVAKPPLSASDWLSGSVQQPDTISSWRPGDPRPPELQRKTKRAGQGCAVFENRHRDPPVDISLRI